MNDEGSLIRSTSRRRLFVPALLIMLALVVAAYDAHRGKIRGDFTKYSLAASRVIWQGGDPYSRAEVGRQYKYLPINALILTPFLALPVPLVQGVWFSLNVALLLWCWGLHQRMLGSWRIPRAAWALALALTFRFFWGNLNLGQWNTAVYCLAFAGLALHGRRPWLGGGLVGAAAALKFMPALFLVWLALKRRWRAAAALVAALFLAWLVVPVMLLGPGRFAAVMASYREHVLTVRPQYFFQSSMVTGHSLRTKLVAYLTPVSIEDADKPTQINVINLTRTQAERIGWAVSLLVVAGAMGISWRRRRPEAPRSPMLDLLEIGLWFMVLLSVSPAARRAHFLTMFTPLLALTALALAPGMPAGLRRLGGAVVAVSLACLLSFSTIVKGLAYTDWFHSHGAVTLWMLALLGASAAVLLNERWSAAIAAGIPPAEKAADGDGR
ncbi:MAG: hypothetical protein Kow0059_15440 [Candidatus Sumerlaeia bacterium]